MKRVIGICSLLMLCLGLLGCQNESNKPTNVLPPLSSDEMDTVSLDSNDYVYGEIVDKLLPNALALKLSIRSMKETWGETVYVITDQADEWCIGDYIEAHFSTVQRPHDISKCVRIIADEINPFALSAKPILYLYPKVTTTVSVKVSIDGRLTCTYPEHGADGWKNFIANPDGTLVFPDGKKYYALYWEGLQSTQWDFSQGWCVRGEDTAAFLEWALAKQGLTEREANEFIVYWLPLMQDNIYNVISFQTTAYADSAALEITPAPDSLLRVFMAYYAADAEVEMEPQELKAFERQGFTVVEWGGSEVKKP